MSNVISRILITGPESTAKTWLSRALAEHFYTLWVPEYARFYLTRLRRNYEEDDLLSIARGQLMWEDHWANKANHRLFCDTGMLVMHIWSTHKYQRTHPWILEQLQSRKYELCLLCRPDLPWEEDPLREAEALDERMFLFEQYQLHLRNLQLPFVEIGGEGDVRFEQALAAVNKI